MLSNNNNTRETLDYNNNADMIKMPCATVCKVYGLYSRELNEEGASRLQTVIERDARSRVQQGVARQCINDHLGLWCKKRKKSYLTHSTHFIYRYMASDCCVRNQLLPLHGLLFLIGSIPQTGHTTIFVTPVVEHWLE